MADIRIKELEKLPFERTKSWEDWAEKVRLRLVDIEHKINEIIRNENSR